ncbi:elongation factor Ts [Pseudomonas aeruginosa]|nr:elongation factor Ts [Pseudomonas aeruginosa]
MAEITAAMVKELRERTAWAWMECKKALTAAGGDIEKAIDDMRAAGAIKAAKKAGNIAAEGSIAVKIAADNKAAVIIEVNSQTDFLALQDDFKGFVAESLEKAFNEKLTDAAPLVEAREGGSSGPGRQDRRERQHPPPDPRRGRRGRRLPARPPHRCRGQPERRQPGTGQGHRHACRRQQPAVPERFGSFRRSDREREGNLPGAERRQDRRQAGEHRREHGQGPHQQVPRRSEPGRAALS